MEKVEVVIVTGMSGAGKTSAMACFENLNFRCIDNYPIALLEEFGELIKTGYQFQKIALAIGLDEAIKAIRLFINMDWIHLTVVFLDCKEDILIKRYKETRRLHPFLISNRATSLVEAIDHERKVATPVANLANITIDTTKLNFVKFQSIVQGYFNNDTVSPFSISFVSFGYKHGIPKDVDLLFDVRFLPNPFYIPELRELTGNDDEVFNYVMDKLETKEFINKMNVLLDYLFKQYKQEGRMHLSVGVGCTGGQHRSVTLANYFAAYYKKYYKVHVLHRDAAH